ncbi:hypothetical protein Ae201684P_022084 [Aphanomyces euteiches]|uniref:Uncharacterized protein n=1 Tax=Aphanomyces euteiches TaxID=100861 RepID=A0A6G0WA88_9STRA|nr:hypothetical protein Ae201684_017791 [Aphanomyces euteiches]KAH9072507.1 hypothetical protein Ae201684P_022084 [Aphanomyces euteiches]
MTLSPFEADQSSRQLTAIQSTPEPMIQCCLFCFGWLQTPTDYHHLVAVDTKCYHLTIQRAANYWVHPPRPNSKQLPIRPTFKTAHSHLKTPHCSRDLKAVCTKDPTTTVRLYVVAL